MSEIAPEKENGLSLSRRHFVLGAALAGTGLVAHAAQPQVKTRPLVQKQFASWVPGDFGKWKYEVASGVVLPPADILASRLYDNLVVKTYTRPDRPPVTILIAYNFRQDGVLQIHRPEVCYTAGGYALSSAEAVDLQVAPGHVVPASFFTASGVQRTEQILYWTRIGSSFPDSWVDQRLAVMASNLRGSIPDGVLMRFSVIDGDRKQSIEVLREFVPEFYRAASPRLHRVLLDETT